MPPHISYRGNGGKLSSKFLSCVLFLILQTTLFYKALIIPEPVWCWSPSTRVNGYHTSAKLSPQFPVQYHIVTNYNPQNWLEVYNKGQILLKILVSINITCCHFWHCKELLNKIYHRIPWVLQQRTVLYKIQHCSLHAFSLM